MNPGLLSIMSCLVLALSGCAADRQESAGTVIVNARVIDGSGGPSRNVRVRIVSRLFAGKVRG